MRSLTSTEVLAVSGGDGVTCTPENSGGNTYGGVQEPSSFGDDLISFYESLVQATSHVIERVAEAL